VQSVAAARLVDLVAEIMHAGGCGREESSTIARRLVDSNLVGHDSHGVLRVGKYLEWMRAGWVKPNQTPTIVFENDSIAIVDGNRGFGQVVGEFAGELGIRKAAKTGIALVGLRNCGHLGRVGDWAELAAAANQVSLHFLNTSTHPARSALRRLAAAIGACRPTRSRSVFRSEAAIRLLST
jgi:uncharacterized oxidoreductase